MGTSHSEIYNDDLFTQFKREDWKRSIDLGLYELWENTQNGELCEAYKLDYVPQEEELQHYRFRHYNQNADNFVQIRYVDVEKKQTLCYHGQSYVLTEFIPVKLSDMQDLTFSETCLILKSAFRAFHTMEAFHGPFIPSEELIGINLSGKPKIWLNKDHSKNKADKEIKAEIWQKHMGEVSQNVKRVIEIVEQKSKDKHFPKEFRDYFFDNVMNFSQASQYVQEYCEKYHIIIPQIIEYIKYLDDQDVMKIVNEYLSNKKIDVMLQDRTNLVNGYGQEEKQIKLIKDQSAVRPFSRSGSEQSFVHYQKVHYLPAQNIHYKAQQTKLVPIQRVLSPTNTAQRPVSFKITVPPASFVPVYRGQQRRSSKVVFLHQRVQSQKTIPIVSANGEQQIRKILNNDATNTLMHIGNHVSFVPPNKIVQFEQPMRTQFSDVKEILLPNENTLPSNQQQQQSILEKIKELQSLDSHKQSQQVNHEIDMTVEKQILSKPQIHEESSQFQNGYINNDSQFEPNLEHEDDNGVSEPDWEGIRRQQQWHRQQQNKLSSSQDQHDFEIKDEYVEHYSRQNINGLEKHENSEISLIKQNQQKNISQFEGHYAMFSRYAMGNKNNQQQQENHDEEQSKNLVMNSFQGRNNKFLESQNVVSEDEHEEDHHKIQQTTQDHYEQHEISEKAQAPQNLQKQGKIIRKLSSKNTSINRGTREESSGTMVIHESKENIYQGVLEEKFDNIVIANIQQDPTEEYCESRDDEQNHQVNHDDENFQHNKANQHHEQQFQGRNEHQYQQVHDTNEHITHETQANEHEQLQRSYDDQYWKKLQGLQSQKQIPQKDQEHRGYLNQEQQRHFMDSQHHDYARQQLLQFEQQQREYVQQQRMRQQSQQQQDQQYHHYYEQNAHSHQYRSQQEASQEYQQQQRQVQSQEDKLSQIEEDQQIQGQHQQQDVLPDQEQVLSKKQSHQEDQKESSRRSNQYDNLHFRNESQELYQYTPVESVHKKEHSYSYQPVPRPHYPSGVEEITQIETHQDIENYIRNKYANLIQPTVIVTQRPESQPQKIHEVRKRSTKDYNRAMTFAKPSQQDQEEEPQINTNEYDDHDHKQDISQDSQKNYHTAQVEQLNFNGDFLDVGNLEKSLDSKYNKPSERKNVQIESPKRAHNVRGSQGSQEDGMNIAALDQRLQKFEERQSIEREKSQRKLQSSYVQELTSRNQNELNFNELDNIVQLMDKKIQESQMKQKESYHDTRDQNVSDYDIKEDNRHPLENIRLETSINQFSSDLSLKNIPILGKESVNIASNSNSGSKRDYLKNYGFESQDYAKGGNYRTYEYQPIQRIDSYKPNNQSYNLENQYKAKFQSTINSASKVLNDSNSQGTRLLRKSSRRSTKNNEDAKKISDRISDKYEKYMNDSSASGKPFAKKSYYDSGASFESSKNQSAGYADYSSKYNIKDSGSYPSNRDLNRKISSYLNPIEELNGENNPSPYRQQVGSKNIWTQLSSPLQSNLQNISKFSNSSSRVGSKKNIGGENPGKGSKVSYDELRDLLWK